MHIFRVVGSASYTYKCIDGLHYACATTNTILFVVTRIINWGQAPHRLETREKSAYAVDESETNILDLQGSGLLRPVPEILEG
jgi:hypothetical protein